MARLLLGALSFDTFRVNDMSTETVELQKKILEVFIEVKKICDKHNIRYFAVGGTCIGAVRHNGFIPWDDDLDIAVPINDFERLTELCKKELPKPFELFICPDYKHNPNPFIKVHNTQTTFIEKYELDYPDDYKGVFIDIFPLIGIPSDEEESKKYNRKLRLLTALNEKWHYSLHKCPGIKGVILWVLTCPLRPFLRKTFWADKLYKNYRKNDFDSYEYISYTWFPRDYKTKAQKKWFESYVELTFENTKMRCPSGYDEFLTLQFGDYMQLPPESERQCHDNGGIVDIEKPFSYYAKKYRETGSVR